ncbi:hypothetical protein [Mycolicibacterium fallax]|uniref:Uncharacterized protein n=1 Tax=Mycolicibacterium fallax TaxID=1793 RepID=A0A1X1R5E6_MYCFA|nr:hypothetical protein [Mycolicibacterium fallax]ORU99793.1 hypothetical protein AWC04_16360 [Mycolicibacterium fallax]HOW94562.1 hypothetical protein [Mycolicibacterium fallax]HSA41396.1 hypothetical protein [Mycobacterium sp.]
MSKSSRAVPVSVTGAIAAVAAALTVSLVSFGSETALADGGFDRTATNPTPASTAPIPEFRTNKKSATQVTPRSKRKRSVTDVRGGPLIPDTDSSAGSSNG